MPPNTNASLMMVEEPNNDVTSQSSYTSLDTVENDKNNEDLTNSNNSKKSKKSKLDVNTSAGTCNTSIQLHRKRPSRKRKVLLKIRSKMEDPKQKTNNGRRQQHYQRDSSSPISYSSSDVRRSAFENAQLPNYVSKPLLIPSSNHSPTTAVKFSKHENQQHHPSFHQTTPSPSPIYNHSQKQFIGNFSKHQSLNNSINHSPNGYSFIHHHPIGNTQQQQRNLHQPYEVKRRCMELRLIEEGMKTLSFSRLFSSFRRRTQSVDSSFSPQLSMPDGSSSRKLEADAKFDIIRVSWYDGTTTSELQDHVTCAITRKIGKAIMDYRILDEESDEEIVLSPYIPDGSRFLVRYSFPPPVKTIYDYSSTAPYSPSRALTPVNSVTELEKLPELDIGPPAEAATTDCTSTTNAESVVDHSQVPESKTTTNSAQENGNNVPCPKVTPAADVIRKSLTEGCNGIGAMTPEMRSADPVTVVVKVNTPMQQCKYVVWVLAKSFISFLTIVRICAELHERSPVWKEQIIGHMENVEACAVDRDSLFECVSRGDFSGLMASFVIWITSKTTRQFFLFGFDSVQTLYHCVYEAFVSSFCWGCSYMFIRRGLNPDTRTNCLLKYWKDCAYGTLANFFQNFIKTVLKNLIPKEAVKEAFGEAIRATTNKDNKFGLFGLGFFRNKNMSDIVADLE